MKMNQEYGVWSRSPKTERNNRGLGSDQLKDDTH